MENRRWCVASMQQNRCLYGGFGMWRWLVKLSRWVRWLVKLSSSVGVGKVAKRAVGACSPWMIGFCVPGDTGCSRVDLSLIARVARRHVVRWYSSSYGPTWTNWANITNLVCKLSTTAAIYYSERPKVTCLKYMSSYHIGHLVKVVFKQISDDVTAWGK
jgi:hypothetical protein